jgi:hypothetical protein
MTTRTKASGVVAPGHEEDYPQAVDKPIIRIVVSLPESLRDEAAKVARADERSLAYLIRKALREYLDRHAEEGLD